VLDKDTIRICEGLRAEQTTWTCEWARLNDYEIIDNLHKGDTNAGIKFYLPTGVADEEHEVRFRACCPRGRLA
jgi:hypothetical protein